MFIIKYDHPCEDTKREEEEEILLGPKPVNWFLINQDQERPNDDTQNLDDIIFDPIDSSEEDSNPGAITKPKTKNGQKRRKAQFGTKKRATRGKTSVAASAKSGVKKGTK